MSILTEKEIAHIAGAESRNVMEFARAIESAVLAKLAGMELPDAVYASCEAKPLFTAAQLHQAYAQGAVSQLSAEPIYQYQMCDGSWIDQAKHSYEYNLRHAPNAVVRLVYTLKESK